VADYLDTLKHDPYTFEKDVRGEHPVAQSYFVDDSTFMQTNVADMQTVITGISICRFCFATGMEINFEKSSYTTINIKEDTDVEVGPRGEF
jgi:hypothetical protein